MKWRGQTLFLLFFGIIVLSPLPGYAQTEESDTSPPETQEKQTLSYTDALILGLVEGITEYLPISSTGHLVLTSSLLGLDSEDPITLSNGSTYSLKEAASAYAIIIQVGAIAAVVFVYWSRLWGIFLGFLGLNPIGYRLGRNLIVAFIPAAIVGLLLDDWIESRLFYPVPIAVALFLGGLVMLGIERWRKDQYMGDSYETELHALGTKQALLIGIMQCFALWPGMSRSMVTIIGGYLAGLSPRKAAEFSFLLGFITLTAASGYKMVREGESLFQILEPGPVIFGILVATLSAVVAVRWLIAYLTKHGLAIFAWYRFALAIAVLLYFGKEF